MLADTAAAGPPLTAATGDTNSAQVAAAILLVGWVQAASWTNQRWALGSRDPLSTNHSSPGPRSSCPGCRRRWAAAGRPGCSPSSSGSSCSEYQAGQLNTQTQRWPFLLWTEYGWRCWWRAAARGARTAAPRGPWRCIRAGSWTRSSAACSGPRHSGTWTGLGQAHGDTEAGW